MRFKGRMELEHGLKQIDIAPLINIVFLLLIFFMLTSGLITQSGMKVNLPKAVTSETVRPGNIEILIVADNSIYLNSKPVTVPALNALLKQAAKRNQSVLIKADQHSALGRVVEVWDMARDSGITQVNIATGQ